MGLKKKKNILLISLCVGACFLMYQLYIFFKITSADANVHRVTLGDGSRMREVLPLRSIEDVNINEDGVIRGVLISNMVYYRPDWNYEFKCLKSDQRIPFDQVNDNYCDCEDQSDEPSTTACSNGVFYCDSQYKRSAVINSVPSSRLNDGICDCCDGSDEWLAPRFKKLLTQGSLKLIRKYSDKCPNIC